jgi:hypothetical protein
MAIDLRAIGLSIGKMVGDLAGNAGKINGSIEQHSK